MDEMLINGEKVIFGIVKEKCRCWYGAVSGSRHYRHVKIQRWDLPILELHGFVDSEQPITEIKKEIQKEVNYDLEQRRKRELGIGV